MLDSFSAARHQLLMLLIVRSIVIVLATVLMAVNELCLGFAIADIGAQYLVVAHILFALLTLLRLRWQHPVSALEIGGQLAIDLILLGGLFYFTGGSANPFVSFLLFPLVVAAFTLRRLATGSLLVLALAIYAALFMLPSPLPMAGAPADAGAHHTPVSDLAAGPAGGTSGRGFFSWHVFGMWVNFAIIAVLVCTVVLVMAERLKQQQEKINRQREASLKREQLLGIATEAASVAHHMGTPLSTIAVIVNEFKRAPGMCAFGQELAVLESQVELCRRELVRLRSKGELAVQAEPVVQPVLPFIAEVRHEFQLLRPATEVEWHIGIELESVRIKVTHSLRLACLSLLNNAADTSDRPLTVSVDDHGEDVIIDILDQGPGIDPRLQGELSAPVKSGKHSSIGLGLYFSHASVEQVDGSVRLIGMAPHGTLTRITLPKCAPGKFGFRSGASGASEQQ
jgi:two-component system sensor histidine kinase RegB